MKVKLYFFVALIYFFFNSLGLPQGLLYTILLTPFFLLWLHRQKVKYVITQFVAYSSLIVIIHLLQGVDILSFIKSYFLVFTTYVFAYAFYEFLKKEKNLGPLFQKLLIINAVATLLAIIIYFTPWIEVLWTVRNLTLNMRDFPRMQLLTYEPSYYSTLLAPIVLFYIFKIFLKKYSISTIMGYLLLILTPLLLSFSLGVIACLGITLFISVLVFWKHFFKRKRLFYSFVSLSILSVASLLFLIIFFPDNPLFHRINDMILGVDLSARGRTTEALKMATLVAKTKSLIFGVGFGQIKIMGDEVVRNYYNYQADDIPIIRIPSSIGETIGTFGYLGLCIRLILQIYLFKKTRVIKNYYRTAVFVYIFVYQFTGSYLTNIAEYVLWIIAFTPSFHQFDTNLKVNSQPEHSN